MIGPVVTYDKKTSIGLDLIENTLLNGGNTLRSLIQMRGSTSKGRFDVHCNNLRAFVFCYFAG